MRALKWMAFGLLAFGVLVTSSSRQAMAATCSASASAIVIGASCTVNGGLDTITFTSNSLPTGANVQFAQAGGTYTVIVQFTPTAITNLSNTPITGALSYTVQQTYAGTQSVTVQALGSNSSVTKLIDNTGKPDFSVTSTGAQVNQPITTSLLFTVTDTISVGGNNEFALLAGFTNQFYVPEPASLAMFGAGLAGLGLLRRRRRG